MHTTKAQSVLIVEDNADARAMLSRLLEMYEYDVVGVGDGVAALASIDTHKPDVAFIDIGLPGLSGYEVAARIRRTWPNEPLCLVALTGHARPEDRQQALAAGFDEHLIKPVSIDQLLAILARLADGCPLEAQSANR